jgi:dienelactone hydrolase
MSEVAVFHSSLGVREGILDAERRLAAAGHAVKVVDQYGGRNFDTYEEAAAFVESVGFPTLMSRALESVADLENGFICVGFSNGGGMAEHVALNRDVSGVVLCSGALPLAMLGHERWPDRTPVQIHYAASDPFRPAGWPESVAASVRDSGSEAEFWEYPGDGHLFTDAGRPSEFDAGSAELLWARVIEFCARVGGADPGRAATIGPGA